MKTSLVTQIFPAQMTNLGPRRVEKIDSKEMKHEGSFSSVEANTDRVTQTKPPEKNGVDHLKHCKNMDSSTTHKGFDTLVTSVKKKIFLVLFQSLAS